jgi:hypothetical protein
MELSKNPVAQSILHEALYKISYNSSRLTDKPWELSKDMLEYYKTELTVGIEQWKLGKQLSGVICPQEI